MTCSVISILGFLAAGALGMASGPVFAAWLNRALDRRDTNNRLRTENARLRKERDLALTGSAHQRMELARDLKNRDDN